MDAIPVNFMGIDAAESAKADSIDIENYFPLDPELRWGLRATGIRRNGDVIERNMIWQLNGRIERNGKNAWLLGEKGGNNYVISLDGDGLQHHGEVGPHGPDEECSPPLTTISNTFTFRQPHSSPYTRKEGASSSLGFFIHQMTGYETVRLPAGIYRDCLRTDTYYQREGGVCFYSAVHFAPGVGIVRYSFRQVDPARNAVVIYGVQELTSFFRAGSV